MRKKEGAVALSGVMIAEVVAGPEAVDLAGLEAVGPEGLVAVDPEGLVAVDPEGLVAADPEDLEDLEGNQANSQKEERWHKYPNALNTVSHSEETAAAMPVVGSM